MAFTPDNKSFVVGSAYGMWVYKVAEYGANSIWIPFEQPFVYESLYFSQDGESILLEGKEGQEEISFSDGKTIKSNQGTQWQKITTVWDYGSVLKSLDGTLGFQIIKNIDENNYDYSFLKDIREVINIETGNVIYKLMDPTMRKNFMDNNSPEGCDLYSFSMCGNVYSPQEMPPDRVAFSPLGDVLAILYKVSWISYPQEFSILKLYDAQNGDLLNTIGTLTDPVQTFTFSPDGGALLIGFGSGLIQYWDMPQRNVIFNTQGFSSYILDAFYSNDSHHLILQYPRTIDILNSRDGLLEKNFNATAMALSPAENTLAIGKQDGTIQIFDLDQMQTAFKIEYHTDKIYALAFSPDGRKLFSSSQDCRIVAWDAHTGQRLFNFAENIVNMFGFDFTNSRIFMYILSPVQDSNQILGIGSWSQIVSWNMDDGKTSFLISPYPFLYYDGYPPARYDFSTYYRIDPQDQQFFVYDTYYDLKTGEEVTKKNIPTVVIPENCSSLGAGIPGEEYLLTVGQESYQNRVCLLEKDTYNFDSVIPLILGNQNDIFELNLISLSPDGKQLAAVFNKDLLYIYQIAP